MQEGPVTPAQEREALQDEVRTEEIEFGIPGVTRSHYLLRPEDEASWLPAWELKVDRFGTEYGVPTRLPKGQLDHYLVKRRPADGGKRFTLHAPTNVLPEPPFECFIGDCQKRVQERQQLVHHIEVCHTQEAAAYGPLLDRLRQAIVQDNPKLASLVDSIAATPDAPARAVSTGGQAVRQASASVAAGHAHCEDCGWTSPKPKKNIALSLQAHLRSCPARKE